jgi:hypothetical protein
MNSTTFVVITSCYDEYTLHNPFVIGPFPSEKEANEWLS